MVRRQGPNYPSSLRYNGEIYGQVGGRARPCPLKSLSPIGEARRGGPEGDAHASGVRHPLPSSLLAAESPVINGNLLGFPGDWRGLKYVGAPRSRAPTASRACRAPAGALGSARVSTGAQDRASPNFWG